MAKIKKLKPEVYNLIAAGEVVETPSGALKELVENSIDAGATRIAIEVSGGGFDIISVADNGCGIQEQDLELAFMKYATSKLESADDLFAVQTLGFRGEALSSISAVSRVKLATRANGSDMGVSVSVDNGVISDKSYVSINVGTKIEVRDLFYNTPARKKFFKSPSREGVEISKFVARLILSNPNLEISYTLDGKLVYETKGNGLEEAIFAVYGAECLSKCLQVAYYKDNLRIDGYVGSPEYTKANRTYQTLSVNGRAIVDQNISGAIMQAFRPYLMTRKYPFYVLNLEIPCDSVDVNVHPKKSEVRFANGTRICSAFYHAVEQALSQFAEQKFDDIMPSDQYSAGGSYGPILGEYVQQDYFDKISKTLGAESLESMNPDQREDVLAMSESTLQATRKQEFEEFVRQIDREVTVQKARERLGLDEFGNIRQPKITIEPTPEPAIEETQQDDELDLLFYRTRILGAAFKTYLILEIDDKIIFVDQHAAHERILFDKFMAGQTKSMQKVMFPYVFTVKDDEATFIDDNLQNILAAGIEIEPFGSNTYRITAVSTLLADTKMDEFVQFLLSGIEDFKLDDRALIVEKIAKKACKAAVKAGYSLNEFEIKYILKEVYSNHILQCPHGRPITVVFSKTQIEKMFKRIV